jgi:hypothetical protein
LTRASTLAALRPVGGVAPLLLGEQQPSEYGRPPTRMPGDAAIVMQLMPQTYAALHTGHPLPAET